MNKVKQTGNFLPGTHELVPCGHACEALGFLQQIYNSAPVIMLAVDPQQKVIRLNHKFVEFLVLDEESCLEKSISELLPQAAQDLGAIINNVIITKTSVEEKEISFNYNYRANYWDVNAYPILDEENEIDRINLIIHDISELRTAQIKLKNAYDKILNLQKKLEQENVSLKSEIARSTEEPDIIGECPAMQEVMKLVIQVAPTDSIVLINGETGTGKELIARAVHKSSQRKEMPLITVNCAALPANLIESELFGHEKGAFTGAINRKIGKFELADKGSIFLDEIGELPLELQSKLLRVLQENQFERIGSTSQIDVDVRVIAATNRDLAAEVKKQNFRQDLYYRLNVFPIQLPRLRDRGNDLKLIAEAYIKLFSEKMGKPAPRLSEVSLALMHQYNWPGNIRELKNHIERAMIMCDSNTLVLEIPETSNFHTSKTPGVKQITPQSLKAVEKAHILSMLEKCNWKVRGSGGAAELLDLKPTTLESKMNKLGIKRPK
ncbi:MAG: sigma-54 interaction domain-containing protein [Candidatus Rifleibacteriota bacterium]